MKLLLSFVVVFFVGIVVGYAQYESSSPSIPRQEFFNPAFNAYKNHGSFNAMFRQQWANSGAHTPEMFAANLFVPTKKYGLGLGGTIVSEDIGLRVVNTVTASVSQGMRIGHNAYLAAGIGLGLKLESYQRSKIKAYPEVDFSDVKMNQSHPVVKLGLMGLFGYNFVGVSSSLRVNDQDFDFTYLTGVDFVAGRVFVLNYDFAFRTTLVGKYYKQTRYNISAGEIEDEFVSPVIDWSVSCLMYDKIWLSAGVRFDQAITSMVNYRLNDQLNIGMKYEIGIGSGYNRFNSQGLYLTYNFKRKKQKRGYTFYKGVFGHTSRWKKSLNEYMY
ncbi:hypothetical protein DF185_09400 [Marinifilum breve]|uniref:Type IX secretion system membrane protein PorP/SprF n=1 Tax=Marinifilum breve TaxID=2184082 RepID=A0A2V3ZZF4_9BACT|nr:type IX secretion system membrane protein PorP/SprF [Marinifilum breve]PXY01673.1 hypothetical protein DF185_09400 [Marinifilum breve]